MFGTFCYHKKILLLLLAYVLFLLSSSCTGIKNVFLFDDKTILGQEEMNFKKNEIPILQSTQKNAKTGIPDLDKDIIVDALEQGEPSSLNVIAGSLMSKNPKDNVEKLISLKSKSTKDTGATGSTGKTGSQNRFRPVS